MQWVFLWPPVPVTAWMCHVGGWGRENSLRYRHSPGYGMVEEGMERLLEASQCAPCPTLSTMLWWWGLAPTYLLWSRHKGETDCSTTIQKGMKSIIRFIAEKIKWNKYIKKKKWPAWSPGSEVSATPNRSSVTRSHRFWLTWANGDFVLTFCVVRKTSSVWFLDKELAPC